MRISVSSTLTLFHDGQFWVGIAEHSEGGKLGVTKGRLNVTVSQL